MREQRVTTVGASEAPALVPVEPHCVSPAAFIAAMRRFTGACAIVTSLVEGEPAGLTATAICSMTADPPRLMVCVNRLCRAHCAIEDSEVLVVNVLAAEHEALARCFAGWSSSTGIERFNMGQWATGILGALVLQDALVSLECRVVDRLEGSTHCMFVAEVVAVNLSASRPFDPLLYAMGLFRRVAP